MQPAWSYVDPDKEDPKKTNPELGDLFEYGAKHLPTKAAIADHRTEYSFSELNNLTNQFAYLLQQEFKVAFGDHVLVLTTKHCLVPAVAVALWKLGAIYVPVDGDSPSDRVAGIAKNVQPKLVINFTGEDLQTKELSIPNMSIDSLVGASHCVDPEKTFSAYQHQNEEIAYIIHTSGSTGVPKGVQISVGSLKQYFHAHNEVLRFNQASRVFSLSPFHFDVSIEDTLLPLSVGAYVYQYNRLHHGGIIRNMLIKQNVTHLIAVSTILTMMSDEPEKISRSNFPSLQMVMTGAEVCAPKVINLWKKALPETRVINAYGPTEVTIVSTCYTIEELEEDRDIAYPIGLPLKGVSSLLLNEDGDEVTHGEPGELCLGGGQVMSGYLNRPEEDAKRLFDREGIRYYRTGDICFLNARRELQFVGRNDDEVKLNGRRIHLGEIQQQCLAIEGVERVSVGVIGQQDSASSSRQIAAVIVSTQPDIVEQVEKHLLGVLPGYMIPRVWGIKDSVSLSSSGKSNDKFLLEQLSQSQDAIQAKIHYLN
ncbi:amino acid adenylation domain-containing protein [Vibrio cholerae]|uniref:amino acid adenylation domain-containing protein n=1 Tax=Vibrio cholerae TaxID=666 RepID=UPI001C2F4252